MSLSPTQTTEDVATAATSDPASSTPVATTEVPREGAEVVPSTGTDATLISRGDVQHNQDGGAAPGSSPIIPRSDHDFNDEGYGSSEVSSYMSSILSSERHGVEENGRVYPSFGKYEYGMPIDEKELDRNDLQHHKFTLLLDDRLYLAPVSDSVLDSADGRVLDLGTGTGVWAIDMADKFPNAQVIGTDIAATQPSFVPPNCIFEIEDAEDVWPYRSEYFDFIHGRDLLTAIRDWPHLMSQAWNALRPEGWIQLASTIPDVRSDDGTLPANAALKEAGDAFIELGEKMGAPVTAPRQWSSQLRALGFINVEDVVIKLPAAPWSKDTRLRNVGALERPMLTEGIEAYLLRGWTQALQRSADELAVLCALARKDLMNPAMHAYSFFHVTYAQKPA